MSTPSTVFQQNYPPYWVTTNLENVPQIPSRTKKSFFSSITVQVVIVVLILVAVAAAIAVPLAVALTATTTTISTTLITETTTTSATTTATTTTITAVLTAYGPQLNFNPSTLSSAWSVCYSALYSTAMFSNISSIISTCYKDKLLLGCRPVGNTLLTLAAMGNRADVLYNCSASSTFTHQSNGVGWYFAMNTANWNSWGFVSGSDSVVRNNCDGDMTTNPAYRLCWHMIGSSGGYRCGSTGTLDTSTSWEKLIYHAM